MAIADVLIKRAAANAQGFGTALFSPLIGIAVVLYMFQIALFSYIFVKRWDLSVVGFAQMFVYAATVVLIGVVIFEEKFTVSHGVGMAAALLGVILMTL